MNQLLEWLKGGTLRSDGFAPQAADLVIKQPQLLAELLEGLDESDDVVRARTADALERVARVNPEPFNDQLPHFIAIARKDPIPMVRWHMAMLLSDLIIFESAVYKIQYTLDQLLDDNSPFVRSWAISGLTILGRRNPDMREVIINRIVTLHQDSSIAVRHRARKATDLLMDDQMQIPDGWVKSTRLINL